ncbi:MAG: tetratricopeptide repeat protein [Limisphaerales bacterium]
MLLVPLLFLLVLEAGLRLAGFGHPASFFLPMKINGRDCFVENDRFGWRFFGPERARNPFPFVIDKLKPPETIRLFVFGESAAYGDPQPEFGLCRVLQALLEGRFPDKHFEVINTAMTGINSHVILPIARDCAGKNADFWVVYMGNNEVVGPYGSGSVFGVPAASLPLVRAAIAFKGTRLGQALGDLIRTAENRPVEENEWGGMVMFLHHHVLAGDPRMATVYASFQKNLNDIIDIGARGGAKVFISTIARNLKDCSPFASDHRPDLSSQEVTRWETFYRQGCASQQLGRPAEAVEAFRQAANIDDTFAEEHFRWGESLLALGQDAEAARQFSLACDDDTLRFRADSRINEIIRRVATNQKQQLVQLVDAEMEVARSSPRQLMGQEFLYEHVHLNFDGNYLVARAVAERIAASLPDARDHSWPTADDCARRLGWNDSTRRAAEMEVLGRLSSPPFDQQSSNREQRQRLASQVEALQTATLLKALRADAALTRAAAETAPADWILQENLAQLQQQTGDISGAVESLRRVARLLPQTPDSWQCLGMALGSAKRDEEAIAAFKEAIRLSPESVVALNSLAELYARANRLPDAEREFREVLRRKPYWGPAHLGLGKVLEAMGRKQEADTEFKEALKNRLATPSFYNSLAKLSFSKGWFGAAVTNYSDSLRLNPSDPEVHVDLGLALVKLGNRPEAKAHYAEAVRLQPAFAEAHFCLGLEMGKDGNTEGAASEFAEAVRLKPELIEARLNLGIALSNQHLNQQALEQFDEVLRRDANNRIALTYAKILRGH